MSIRIFALASIAAILLSFSATGLNAESAKPVASETLTTATLPGMQKLEIKLPKPPFVSILKDIKSKEREPHKSGPRPIYNVPTGTILLSAGKGIASSDEAPIKGELAYFTDTDKDGSSGSFVKLGPGRQYVQIDLEKTSVIHAVVVWHYYKYQYVYRDVIIQVSDDQYFVNVVSTLFNNDDDNSSGLGAGKDKEYIESHEGKLIDGKGTKGRYIRFYSNGNTSNDMNHYVEVEVYGKPLE